MHLAPRPGSTAVPPPPVYLGSLGQGVSALDPLDAGLGAGGLALLAVLLFFLAWKVADRSVRGGVEQLRPGLGRPWARRRPPCTLVNEVMACAIIQLDGQGRVASWNRGAELITGWRSEEVLGQPDALFYPEEEARAGKSERDLEQARRIGNLHQEVWRRRKDNSHFRASEDLTALYDGGDQVTGFTRVTHDITDHWEIEARLQAKVCDLETQVRACTAERLEAEARLQGFIEHAPAAIAFKDLDGRLLLLNRKAEALTGISLIATPAKSQEELFPPELIAKARVQDEQVIARREDVQLEESVSLPEAGVRDFLIQKFPLLDATGRCWGLGVIATDMTELKHQERVRRQRQKLESLGLLAGGIAHDFNNLLGAMLGNLELAKLDLCPHGTSAPVSPTVEDLSICSAEHLQTLEALVTRAATLVGQILAYAGKGTSLVQALDLNRQVEEMTRMLRASLSGRALLNLETTPNLPLMEGDAAQVNQVIMNLILNAAEAMEPLGGVITIRTDLATVTQADLDHRYQGQDLQPGTHLVLEVSDQGSGMPPEVQERIFEPFFTTKFTGRGLGLSAVQGILRSHQGGMQVLSEEGKGTTFKILIPATPGAKRNARSPALNPAEFRGTGTVLVVDDEAPLRAVAVAGLRRMGFDTVEARDGLEALEAFEANRDRVVLILMDMIMPNMDGEEAYRHLRRAGAMVPILLSSGFGHEEALRRFRGKVLAGFLQKPYRFQALVDAIRNALPGRSGSAPPALRAPIAWVPEFETGHPLIDGQHREILQAFNQVVAAAEAGNGAQEEGLARLIELTIAHFGVEEALMGNADDAGLREHRTVHTQLTRQLQELAGKVERGETTLGAPVFDFMEEWLIGHIHFEDRELVRWLKAGGP